MLLLATLMLMMIAGCHGDQYDQPVSRMMVFRDLPDGVEPNHPQHLIIRTGYEVAFLSKILLSFCVIVLVDDIFVLRLCIKIAA